MFIKNEQNIPRLCRSYKEKARSQKEQKELHESSFLRDDRLILPGDMLGVIITLQTNLWACV